jgi:bifunctional non-homologous end joining protein LigD
VNATRTGIRHGPLDVDGHEVELSHTDRVLFPDAGLTKGDLIDYYLRVAPVILPHVRGRPVSLQRYPAGIESDGFFQKNAPDYFPDWIERVQLSKQDGKVDYVLASNPATLVYLANQGTLTLHVGLSRADRIDHPDRLVIDLDPPGGDFAKVKTAARRARELLVELGLVPFLQTTGSRGLHVWVPLDCSVDFDRVREVARSIAELLVRQHPDELTIEQRKKARGDRVYLDVMRNAYGQTAVAPYTVRARSGAPVATPLDWSELDDARLTSNRYTISNIFRRLGRKDDPWREIDRRVCSIESAARRLQDLGA